MNKSLHPIIIFFWGYILFVRVQCQDTLGILNESKLSEHKELCFRRCDIGFQVDDKETSSEEIFRRRSCYERCLREEGEMKSVKTKRRVFVDEQKSSLFKRIRRDATSMVDNPNSGMKYGGENCLPGNAVNETPAMFPTELGIAFHESEGKRKGKYKGIVTWKALQNESVEWTGYKIFIQDAKDYRIECDVVPKTVTHYSITKSFSEGSRLYVMVVSSPHSENLRNYTGSKRELDCIVREPYRCGFKPVVTTSSSTVGGGKTSSTSEPVNETIPISVVTTSSSTVGGGKTSSTSEPIDETIPISEKQTIAILTAVFVASFAFALALLLAFMYYRRRKHYSRSKIVNPLTDLKFEFDAFIIYSSHDSEWVVKTLLPILEKKHQLKCCVHYRDFTLGIPIRKNMVDSVYKSKKTVAVVSTNFFNSNYCGSELDYALHRLMEKNDDSLVVIKLDDVDRNKLPKELQNRSYIDYPKSIEKANWEKKLIKCLKVAG